MEKKITQEPLTRRDEQEIAGTARKLRSILIDASPDGLIALDPRGVILFWSAGAERVYGYAKAEALGARIHDLVMPPEMCTEAEQAMRETIEVGQTVLDTIRRKKDGSAIYVSVTATAVRDEQGNIEFIAESHKDVTQLKVFSHGKILEARYRGLLESVPDAIIMVNKTGRIVLVNSHAEELFGYSRDELAGRPVEDLLPSRYRDGHIGHRTHYFSEPRARAMGAGLELFASRKDGTEFPVEISLSPLKTEEGMFAMSAIRDITDRKKLQEELHRKNQALEEQNRLIQQANRLKSEFLANMSHELRTPLNGIIGFAEIMHDGRVGPVSADHKECLQDILTSARHLLQLINDVLDLSKVEAGRLEFAPEKIDPVVLVGEVRDVVRTLAARKRIRLKIEIDPSLAEIVADPRSLKQVLYNYVSNALKFTPDEGEVVIRIKPETADEFRIEVQDTGVGIRPQDISRLFVEFQQLDTGSSKQYPGTGLGLALTKRIIEAQGGRVGLSSTPGKGSVFHATLPRIYAALQSHDETRLAPVPAGAPLILVVEDDPADRAWIATSLRTAGYAAEVAATGTEALVRCRERRFDAITLDIMLPDMSGRAVLQKLRERGLNQKTPVVVVTVLANRGVIAGFQIADILSKPVSQTDLVNALQRLNVNPETRQPILVVDDDGPSLKLAGRMLRQLGYRTVCRQDARSALQAASKVNPAAVVLDLVMPEMNGFEFLKHFRNTSGGRRTPVIVWTGKHLTSAERVDLRAMTAAVAKKSENAEELVQEIQNILRLPDKVATEAVKH
jgi:PAS domain S-box-containing protein